MSDGHQHSEEEENRPYEERLNSSNNKKESKHDLTPRLCCAGVTKSLDRSEVTGP